MFINSVKYLYLFILLVSITTFAQIRDTTIKITTSGGLRFDQTRIIVRPNTRLKLIFLNNDDMAHNLVVTKPNSRQGVVRLALMLGEKGPVQHYVPIVKEVLAHTSGVEPGNRDSLEIVMGEGAYPFVCTYPGHGSIMYGIIYATAEPNKLPSPEKDLNIPNPVGGIDKIHQHHQANAPSLSVNPKLPIVSRTFLPECGPAAIAVRLPGSETIQSYVFDAAQCRLRYAWSGGFIDNTAHWDGPGKRLAQIIGEIYFRNTEEIPWQIGTTAGSAPQFKGYRLVNHYPEFIYTVNGVEIRELIKPALTRLGLTITYTIAPTKEVIIFSAESQAGIRFKTSVGMLKNGKIRLPSGTRQFKLTVTAVDQ